MLRALESLVDVSDFFFLVGEGEGRVRDGGRGGGQFFIENPRRGGGGFSGRGRGQGAERVSVANWGIFGGGGLNIFFGAEMSTKSRFFVIIGFVNFCHRVP